MNSRLASVFGVLFGVFLGLTLLKFGNPPIMERYVTPPTNIYEFLLDSPWPISWAYRLLGALAILGLVLVIREDRRLITIPKWLLLLPLIWLACQIVAAAATVDEALSWATLKHLAACISCYYLGLFALSRLKKLALFWIGLLCAFVLVIAIGWQQHFGGLQATREFFFREIYPQLKEVPPEYLKKLSSNRIFSTLFYPNSLAGALLLMLPISVAVIGNARELLTLPARAFLAGLVALSSLGCLFWSGSKGGWLLMLVLGSLALFRLPFQKSTKLTLIAGLSVLGLAGFLWKYAGFFEKGATSVSARVDYWHAAVQVARTHPLLGTGPGTFAIPYKQLKRPESEMTRLVHNDYLQQASDSGWPGFLAYLTFILGSLCFCGTAVVTALNLTKTDKQIGRAWISFSIWLGVLGWSLQSLFDFGLYIPALAWPAFTFLGLLIGHSSRIQSTNPIAEPNVSARHENPVPQRPKSQPARRT
ncbi:MAG TPA: O-antigen ligase family protein [Candidatus Limnocylindrales bacterium]|nr:O-antigen ligase family protein [Candidatus Limnocylindrales bacterium]